MGQLSQGTGVSPFSSLVDSRRRVRLTIPGQGARLKGTWAARARVKRRAACRAESALRVAGGRPLVQVALRASQV